MYKNIILYLPCKSGSSILSQPEDRWASARRVFFNVLREKILVYTIVHATVFEIITCNPQWYLKQLKRVIFFLKPFDYNSTI